MTLLFRQARPDSAVSATRNQQETPVHSHYDDASATLHVTMTAVRPQDTVTITLSTGDGDLLVPANRRLDICRRMLSEFRLNTRLKASLYNQLPAIVEDPALLEPHRLHLTTSQMWALLEVITGAGCDRRPSRSRPDDEIVMWRSATSPHTDLDIRYRLLGTDLNGRPILQKEPVPHFAALLCGPETLSLHTGDQPTSSRLTVASWFDSLTGRLPLLKALPDKAVVQFDITGDNGRTAALVVENGAVTLRDGRLPDPTVTITAEDATWLALINGEATPETLFLQGKLNIAGNLELVLLLAEVISIAPPSKFRAAQWQLTFTYQDLLTITLE